MKAPGKHPPHQISDIKVKAFKSFGRSWVEFRDLHKRLNGVVGPNGSGKSNLLEAVTFAAACPLSMLRMKNLPDLISTDADHEVCEVILQIRARSGTGPKSLVHAFISPDMTRTYKINGKLQTGQQVREYLRERGLVLEGGVTVICQAQVTQVADSNSSSKIADVIAGASGLKRWTEDTAAAMQELARTRRSLEDINGNIQTLEASIGQDKQALQQAAELQKLQTDISILGRQLTSNLQARIAQLKYQQKNNELEAKQLQEEKQQQEAKLVAAEQELKVLSDKMNNISAAKNRGITKVLAKMAETEEQIAAVREEIHDMDAQAAKQLCLNSELEHWQGNVARLQTSLQLQASWIHDMQTAMDEDVSGEEQKHMLQRETNRLETYTKDLNSQLSAAIQELETSSKELQAANVHLSRLETSMQEQQKDPGHHSNEMDELRSFDLKLQGYATRRCDLQAQLIQLNMQAQQQKGSLAAMFPNCFPAGVQNKLNVQQLYECFHFKGQLCPGVSLKDMATALSCIAGNKLGIMVVPNFATATAVMEAFSSGSAKATGAARIWPLDNLVSRDNSSQQMKAVKAIGSGKVRLAPDLAECESQYQAAVQKAFGGLLIAEDDATAARLAIDFGLGSVTWQGTVSYPGAMSGGYVSGGQGGFAFRAMQLKLECDCVLSKVRGCQEALTSMNSSIHELELQREKLQSAVHEKGQLADKLAHAQQRVAMLQMQVEHQRQSCSDIQCSLQQSKDALQRQKELLQAVIKDGRKGTGCKLALTAELVNLRKQNHEHQKQLEEAQAKVDAVLLELDALQALQGTAQPLDRLHSQLQQLESLLGSLNLEHTNLQVKQKQREAECQEHKYRCQQAQTVCTELKASIRTLHARLDAACRRMTKLHSTMKSFEGHLQQLQEEPWWQAYWLQEAQPEQPISEQATSFGQNAVAQLEPAELKALQTRLAALQARSKTLQDACNGRMEIAAHDKAAQVECFRDNAKVLEAAVEALGEGIQESEQQVKQFNNTMFAIVDAKFSGLCAAALPSMEFRLNKTGNDAADGVAIQFKRCSNTSRSAEGPLEWMDTLDQLSGGQKTLVSLALLIAAAKAGTRSGILLLDEADAALDEENQRRVAELLLALSRSDACQIVCVTHNATFQHLCDHLMQVSNGSSGTEARATSADNTTGLPEGKAKKPRRNKMHWEM